MKREKSDTLLSISMNSGINQHYNKKAKGDRQMALFNIISGICSIVGLLVSIFTASTVIKISKTYSMNNKDDHSKVINKGSRNVYNSSYVGRDSINETESRKQE